MTEFQQLVLFGLATIIRLLLRDYRDDGRDAILLAEEMEKVVEANAAKHVSTPPGPILLIIIIGLVLVVGPADAAWRWPWEVRQYHPRVHHHRTLRRHHQRPQQRAPENDRLVAPQIERSPPVDCERINEAVNGLDPERLARALRLSTKEQRETILKCGEKKE